MNTANGSTHLALVEKDSHHRAIHGLIHVRVGKDDVRGFAAQFQ